MELTDAWDAGFTWTPTREGTRAKRSIYGRQRHNDGSNTENKFYKATDPAHGTALLCVPVITSYEQYVPAALYANADG